MSTEERTDKPQDEGRPIGVNSRHVFLVLSLMIAVSIILLLVIRYAFL